MAVAVDVVAINVHRRLGGSLGVTWIAALLVSLSVGNRAYAEEGDTWRTAVDVLVYSDTDSVSVVSPQLAVSRSLDEDGGEASARVVTDRISAASVDVLSQATTRFTEIRSEVDLGLSKSIANNLLSSSYRLSDEPDCGSLDCHGDPGRSFRLYAKYGLRLRADLRIGVVPDGGVDEEEVTPDELQHNAQAIAAMPTERVLGKPLAV